MRQIGRGYSAAYKLCATLNFPQMSKTTYSSHEEKLLKAVSEVAECSMRNAADDIVKQQQNFDDEEILKSGASVDGIWQQRGHTFLNGCVTVISIDTGKV